jgi:hypothetical protein
MIPKPASLATCSTPRDPYYPHVALATPVGYSRWYSSPVKHNRWLTLDESTEGTILYDELLSDNDVEFDDWKLEYRRSPRPGASIDALNRGDNTIVATTCNVARFTIWLHPRMVDVTKPVTVIINGRETFKGMVKPSLASALESYLRRKDWGLVYFMKIELTAEDGS